MCRVCTLSLSLVLFHLFAVTGVSAQVAVVHIRGREPSDRHEITRVIGTRWVPYSDSYTIGNTRYTTSGVRAENVFGPVCLAPCTTLVPIGSLIGVDGISTDEEVFPHSGATLVVDTEPRDGWHALGWTIDLAGLAGGAALALSVLFDNGMAQIPSAALPPLFDDEWEITRWVVAGGVVLVTQIVGLALIGLRPLAHVEVIPAGVRF